MIFFKEWFVQTLTNDATLRGLLGASSASSVPLYPFDVDIQPDTYPVITYSDSGMSLRSVPKVHTGHFQFDIWSINNAIEVENIYERIAILLNFQHTAIATQPTTGTLWWIREATAKDMASTDRRIWRKNCDLMVWFSNTDGH